MIPEYLFKNEAEYRASNRASRVFAGKMLLAMVALMAFLLWLKPAHAAGFISCSGGDATLNCFFGALPSADAKVITMPGITSDEEQRRDDAWMKFCQPTFRTDELGAEHYVYAHRGCEFGRSK